MPRIVELLRGETTWRSVDVLVRRRAFPTLSLHNDNSYFVTPPLANCMRIQPMPTGWNRPPNPFGDNAPVLGSPFVQPRVYRPISVPVWASDAHENQVPTLSSSALEEDTCDTAAIETSASLRLMSEQLFKRASVERETRRTGYNGANTQVSAQLFRDDAQYEYQAIGERIVIGLSVWTGMNIYKTMAIGEDVQLARIMLADAVNNASAGFRDSIKKVVDSEKCVVCTLREPKMILMRCGHKCACASCWATLNVKFRLRCPLCKSVIVAAMVDSGQSAWLQSPVNSMVSQRANSISWRSHSASPTPSATTRPRSAKM